MSSDALAVTRVPDAVFDAARESILSQREAPESAVTEQAIADRFGVARPTAKVALERLVADGLLRRTAHKTARVPELTRDDIVDLYANRAIVEEAAARTPSRPAHGKIELCIGQVIAHRLLLLDDVVAQHQGILDAVAAGDPERAGTLTRAHIEGAPDRLLARYDDTHAKD